MALEHVKLADPQAISDTAASIYTNPSGKKTLIKLLWLANRNTTSETVTLYYVPNSGGSVGTAGNGTFIGDFAVAPRMPFVIPIESNGLILMEENDTIQAQTTTDGMVNVIVCGALEAF